MEVMTTESGRELTLALRGELDHHGAKDTIAQLERAIDSVLPQRLTLDFSGVSFMDSSGLAVVMRAQRRMLALGGRAAIANVPPQAKKVFDAAGIQRFVAIR